MHQTGFPGVYSRLLTGPFIVSNGRPCEPVENQLAFRQGIDDITPETRPVFVKFFGSWRDCSKGGLVPFPQVLMGDIAPKGDARGVSIPDSRIALTASRNGDNAPPGRFSCPGDRQDMVAGSPCQSTVDADPAGVFKFRRGSASRVRRLRPDTCQVCQGRACRLVRVFRSRLDQRLTGGFYSRSAKTLCAALRVSKKS